MQTTTLTVPVDWYAQSLRALEPARVMAEQLAIPLTLLSVVPSDDLVAVREADLRGVLHERDITARLDVVADSSPSRCLVARARRQADQLFCLSTHARGSIAEAIMGSVAFHVLRESGRPILLIGPAMSDDWGPRVATILLALDGSDFAEAMIEPAADLARRMRASLRLLQVFNPDVDAPPPGQDSAEWAYLRRLAGRLARDHGITADWETLHGTDPGKALAEYARQVPGGLIAMTTHGRTGAARVAMGGVAQSVCRHAPTPLFVLCPEVFAA